MFQHEHAQVGLSLTRQASFFLHRKNVQLAVNPRPSFALYSMQSVPRFFNRVQKIESELALSAA